MSKHLVTLKQLPDRIDRCSSLAVPLEAILFRFTSIPYATKHDILSGTGAGNHGGRWNPRGIRAVYGSLDPATATEESYQGFRLYGFSKENVTNRVVVSIRLRIARLLDLTDAKIRRRLGVSAEQLLRENWRALQKAGRKSRTQEIGRGCRAAGFEALMAPSARQRGGKNVVVFPDSLDGGSSLELVADDDLPAHSSS